MKFRILISIGALASIFSVVELKEEWFLAFSALGRSTVGFETYELESEF